MAQIDSRGYAFGHMALTMSSARYLARIRELMSGEKKADPQTLLAVTYLMGVNDMALLYLNAVKDKDSVKGSIASIDARVIELLDGGEEGEQDAEG